MKKINIQDWKEFKINSIFDIKRPTSRSVKKYDEGHIPFVSSGNYNNGIDSYRTPLNNELLDEGNCITVSPVDGSTFYQETDFLGRGGGGSSILLLYNQNINKDVGLFLATVIRSTLTRKYQYNDMGSSESIKEEYIKLPVDINGEPDWEYMERYVKQLYARERESSNYVTTYVEKSKSHKIDITKWKRFNLYDEYLFNIDSGTKLDKVKMTMISPKVNFIGRSNFNNGITEQVDLIKEIKPYESGNLTLSLGGYLGSCFIQKEPFYTSQNVIVLIPKLRMSEYCKKFIATMIFKESQTYYKAFENELNRHIKRNFSIYLPVKSDNSPDWKYMEAYMMKLENQIKQIINKG